MASRTEEFDSRFAGLDQWSDDDFLMALWEGQMRAVASVGPVLGDLAAAANEIARRLSGGGRLVYVGAGTSGTVAWQDAKELGGTFGWPEEHTIVMLAGGLQSNPEDFNGAEDDVELASREISQYNIMNQDVVIGIAASGATPYTIRALEKARERDAYTVGICNNPDGKILSLAECGIYLESAPEVVAGSTRMGAGTAQKAALNILSTLVMNKLGRLFDNLMVGMRAENIKLHARAIRIVAYIASCDEAQATVALKKSEFDIRSAVLVVKGHTPVRAQEILALSNGNLRAALEYRD